MNHFDIDIALANLRDRANNCLLTASRGEVVPVLDAMIANRKAADMAQRAAEWKDLCDRALKGDSSAQAEVTRVRVTRIHNFLVAMNPALSFFKEQALAPDEAPYIQIASMQEVRVATVGQDGGYMKGRPLKYQKQNMVLLEMIASEIVEYLVFDLYKGDLSGEMKACFNIARDLNAKISTKLWGFLKAAAVATFTTTGAFADRHYVAHSSIFTANLPAGNLVTVPGATTSTLFAKAALDSIIEYTNGFTGVFDDGDLVPQVVHVPSKHSTGFLSTITMTTAENKLANQVIETGSVIDYGGKRWVIMPEPTLDPAEGIAYVRFNKPVGIHYTKPAADVTLDDTSDRLRLQNKARMGMSKAFGAAIPKPWAVNFLAVKYQTQP